MSRTLTLCLLALCSLSAGCNLYLAAGRNICAEIRDNSEAWSEWIHERRAATLSDQEISGGGAGDGGHDAQALTVGAGETAKPVQLPPPRTLAQPAPSPPVAGEILTRPPLRPGSPYPMPLPRPPEE